MSTTFEKFQEYLHQIQRFNQVQTLLYWDMKTQMPKGALPDTPTH